MVVKIDQQPLIAPCLLSWVPVLRSLARFHATEPDFAKMIGKSDIIGHSASHASLVKSDAVVTHEYHSRMPCPQSVSEAARSRSDGVRIRSSRRFGGCEVYGHDHGSWAQLYWLVMNGA